jgi:hypothetical protein
LNEELRHGLTQCDVFSLGCTIYEAASGLELAKNGDEWQAMRTGQAPRLERYSALFNEIVMAMLRCSAVERPSIDAILEHPCLAPQHPCDVSDQTAELLQLRQDLEQERLKNSLMQRQAQVSPLAARAGQLACCMCVCVCVCVFVCVCVCLGGGAVGGAAPAGGSVCAQALTVQVLRLQRAGGVAVLF